MIFLGRREIEKAPLRITGAGEKEEETGRDRRLGGEGGDGGTDSKRGRQRETQTRATFAFTPSCCSFRVKVLFVSVCVNKALV